MKPKYLIAGNHLIADIGKTASSSLYRAVLTAHYPEIEAPIIVGADMSNSPNNGMRNLCPRTETPDKPTIILVRDAVERFRSAFAQSRLADVDVLLDKLEAGGREITNYHFRPVSDYTAVGGEFLLFRFPEDLDAATTLAALETPLPIFNDGESNNPPKPTLTPEQVLRVEAIYAADITLRESITEAGQALTVAAPEPEPEPIYVPQSIISWQAQAALKLTPFGEGSLYDAVIAALAGMPDGAEKIVAQTAFEKDARFNRDSPTINNIALALELDKEAIDALFILGDSLEV